MILPVYTSGNLFLCGRHFLFCVYIIGVRSSARWKHPGQPSESLGTRVLMFTDRVWVLCQNRLEKLVCDALNDDRRWAMVGSPSYMDRFRCRADHHRLSVHVRRASSHLETPTESGPLCVPRLSIQPTIAIDFRSLSVV